MRILGLPANTIALRVARTLVVTLVFLMAHAAQSGGQSSTPVSYNRTSRIAGSVVSAKDGSPLDRARVFIDSVRDRQQTSVSLVTKEDGRFVFDQVAPGKYSLHGAKRGFRDGAYDEHEQFSTAIVTGAGLDTGNLILRLMPSAIMTVKVVDEAGEAVRQADVVLLRDTNLGGRGRTIAAGEQRTNDLGEVEFLSLAPGNYFVSATAAPWYAMHAPSTKSTGGSASVTAVDRTLDVTYAVTFFPNAFDIGEAAPIPITSGDRIDIDIHLSPVPALHMLFRLPQTQGKGSFPSLQRETSNGDGPMVQGEVRNLGEDLFEISGLTVGKYKVRINGPGQPMRTSEVTLTSNGQEFEASAAETAGSVKATVALADGSRLPIPLRIALLDSNRAAAAIAQVNEKGEANLDSIDAGEYRVSVWGQARPYNVTRINDGEGPEIAGQSIKIAAGSQRTVRIIVSSGMGRVQGFVKHDGSAAAGAMVVLVPKDPGLNRELFRRDQSDLDGSFDLQNIIPGDYKILAIEDGWNLEWSNPDVIAHYLARAQTVIVGDTGDGARSLDKPIDLQPR